MNPTLTVWLQLAGLLALEAAVIAGIAAQLQRLTGSAAWRRTIWHACILGLSLLVIFEFTGTARGIFAWGGKKPAVTTPSAATGVNARALFNQAKQGSRSPVDFQPTPGMQATGKPQSASVIGAPESIAKPGAVSPQVRAATDGRTGESRAIPAAAEFLPVLWLGLVWLAGAVLVMGRVLVCRMALGMIRWKRSGVEEVDLRESVRALALRLGIRRRVRLMESARICSPAAFGIFRPTIGLPPQFGRKFNFVQRQAMLAHELAHLAGNDPAWYLLADVLAAALWWHPLVWWSRRQLHAQSEQAADEASLLVADGPGVLAECLVELGARLARTRSLMPLGVAGNGFRSGLGRRVERLVKLEGSAWRPPSRIRRGLAVVIGPVALVTAAILCTAWVVPPALTKGENMQTMKQTWKKSLAAFALLTAFSPDGNRAIAQTTATQPAAGTLAVAGAEPGVFASGQASGASSTPAGSSENFADSVARFNRMTMSKQQQAVEEKLERIIVSNVMFDQLPLSEVIKNLIETSAKQARDGVNFVLDREAPASATTPGSVDPATGLPLPTAAEIPDLGSVTIKINPALKNVRLVDVLDAITKTADQPIHYTIEDYGVVFSLGAAKPQITRSLNPEVQKLEAEIKASEFVAQRRKPLAEVMTFKVDTNTFFANMERTFGEKPLNDHPFQIRATLQDVFQKYFGINLAGPEKAIFYNVANGIIMVRGTSEDVAAMRGVIEMLGGAPYSGSDAATYQRDREYERMVRGKAASGGGGSGGSGGSGGGAVVKQPGNQ